MTPPARTSGDTIADQIKHHQKTDTDLSDVQHSLVDAHDHRPGLWQSDLAKANKALHDQGFLPGMDIVGTRGQDLVMRDKDGHTQIVDATNINHKHQDNAGGNDSTVNGRHAKLNPDGSGTVTANYDDKYGWNLSKDLLKNQGVDNPTPTQMANYQMELEKLNGKKISQFKNGDEIKVPPTTKGGDTTEFQGDRIEDKAKQQRADLDQNMDLATKAFDKIRGYSRLVDQDGIKKALAGNDLSADERKGAQFLLDHFDEMRNKGGIMFRDDAIFGDGMSRFKQEQQAKIEQERLLAYRD